MICHDLNQSARVSLVNTAEGSCDDESCSATAVEQASKKRGDSSVLLDANALKEEGTGVDKGEAEHLNRDTKESVTLVGKILGGMSNSSIQKPKGIKRFQRCYTVS